MLTKIGPVRLLVLGALAAGALAGCSGGSSDGATDQASVQKSASTTVVPKDGCDGSVESPDTRFIVDRCGRVVILRGVNVESASKGTKQSDSHLPATPLDAQRLLDTWGWNNVRFLVFWGAIEPKKGTFDEKYLDHRFYVWRLQGLYGIHNHQFGL